jgi:hypothetical protein
MDIVWCLAHFKGKKKDVFFSRTPKEDGVITLPLQYPRSLAYPMSKANDTSVQAHSLTLDPEQKKR